MLELQQSVGLAFALLQERDQCRPEPRGHELPGRGGRRQQRLQALVDDGEVRQQELGRCARDRRDPRRPGRSFSKRTAGCPGTVRPPGPAQWYGAARLLECSTFAGVAQLVEQRIRNAKVGSSTLLTGTITCRARQCAGPNLLGRMGRKRPMPEWPRSTCTHSPAVRGTASHAVGNRAQRRVSNADLRELRHQDD